MAMSAARLGQPDKAVDMLLMEAPKNEYLSDGFNWGQPEVLPLYLPGNGGLLYATALMAAGWDGASGKTPGFPKNGRWDVKYEGIHPAP
jgi:protein-glucosylgalactosylhydroxylysine glucosidase